MTEQTDMCPWPGCGKPAASKYTVHCISHIHQIDPKNAREGVSGDSSAATEVVADGSITPEEDL